MNVQTFTSVAATGMLLGVFTLNLRQIFKPNPSPKTCPVIFFALVFLSMLALRLPGMTCPYEFNSDETGILAQGMRYVSHPVPWRDVDGTTSGPLSA